MRSTVKIETKVDLMQILNPPFSIKVPKLLAAQLVLLCTSQAFGCTVYPLKQPVQGSVIADIQPEIHWIADQHAQSRVQISAIAPESKVLLSVDTVVQGGRFKFPAAIPAHFAAVKVLISQNCNRSDAQDLNAQGPAFFIDNTKTCVMEMTSPSQQSRTLTWGGAQSAKEYIVRVFEISADFDRLGSQTLLVTHKTFETKWELPNSINLTATDSSRNPVVVAAIQPICDGRPGTVQSLLLKPTRLKN